MNSRNSKTIAIGAVAALLVVSGIVLAVVASSDDGDVVEGAIETAAVEVTGDPLPRFAPPIDEAVGQNIPTVQTSTIDGSAAELAPDGTPRLIGFVAHWCPHCQRELPRAVEWLDENELPDGVELVLVSTAVDTSGDNYPPSAWFAREGWEGTTLVDDENGSTAAAYGLSGFPFWVAVDDDGLVVQRAAGELSTEAFEALLAMIG